MLAKGDQMRKKDELRAYQECGEEEMGVCEFVVLPAGGDLREKRAIRETGSRAGCDWQGAASGMQMARRGTQELACNDQNRRP
jgi:hypothetical protein